MVNWCFLLIRLVLLLIKLEILFYEHDFKLEDFVSADRVWIIWFLLDQLFFLDRMPSLIFIIPVVPKELLLRDAVRKTVYFMTWCKKPKTRRAEANERRARAGYIPRELQVGEQVLLRRPPPHLRDDPVSRRLQSKAAFSVDQVIKKVGDIN